MRRVVITGLGIVSCIGNNKVEVLDSLINAKSGIVFSEEHKKYNFRSQVIGTIKNLNLDEHISEIFSIDEIIPSAGQGVIALQCKSDDEYIKNVLKKINDEKTFKNVQAERNVLKVLEGDCETAVGAISVINNENITLEGELFSLDGKERFYCKSSKDIKHAAELGMEIGENLKSQSKGSYKK